MTSAAAVPNIGLNDENTIPVLGIGVGELTDDEAERAVSAALEIGVRLIDTAAAYGNEAGVGRAIAASGIPRAEIFLTTKLATQDQGFQASQDAAKASLDRLGVDYLDLYLIHWPGGDTGKYVDSWGGLLRVREDKLATSIGVANFTPEDLTNIIDLSYVAPAVNQIELHPQLVQTEQRAAHAEHNIVTEAYSPLGVGKLLDNPTVTAVAAQYDKTPAQVLIRWNLQLGNVVIPRSAKPERIAENFDVLDFELAEEHLAALTGLDDGTRYRPDPATYTGT
ncbi:MULTISPECIES: aldo/keto reductase [Mycobacteriaceae]|uniref:2,5-diketo-D-gluconic acid reductase n=1 Tax=Mycolicibacterium neoaurum VKM Ac-1815D TaxID=700508 RepID=V5XB71_MYCNE|nr:MULTISPECIES: aldo/keto reductase [Mycobacteriaceae]AHC25048.1 2,5-diketo-D-gluconic acid reductase [Mycolicibacterium neoaurum VKM Ac-1815D]AMO05567.1 2,5-diketo-D-gluconic acid reductase [Mycolicibacterium neoaurum]AXK76113.1 aldo/keto reductase [Mycolicibacterium neoaurum]KJQ50592.1 2,5-diketo-D-gluconic acid reductase [Mycolicibacterium neoaurum]KUM09768.1 2,5-diketo-D-gluconic acid reductase [Mycolicibacterium neoaurum]